LFSATDALLAALGAQLDLADRLEFDRHLAALRETLDGPALAEAWAEGRAMQLEQAVEIALKLGS